MSNGNINDAPKPAHSEWLEFAGGFGSIEEDRRQFLDPPTIVPTGFGELDRRYLNAGMVPGVYTVMAEPGAGKSALAIQVALSVAKAGGRVLYLSAEMERSQCVARAASNLAFAEGPGSNTFRWSDWERMGRSESGRVVGLAALERLHERCPGLVFADRWGLDGESGGTVEDAGAVAARAKALGMDLLVVDYLQALEPPAEYEGDTFGAITSVTKVLTGLARRLRVPVLLISSMGRAARKLDAGETIGGGYGSSRIEYDATAQFALEKTGESADGCPVVALHITKNRRGPLTPKREGIRLVFDAEHNRLSEF